MTVPTLHLRVDRGSGDHKIDSGIGSAGKNNDYELSASPTAASSKSVAAKDFSQFPPARKEVLATLIVLALSEVG
jgi:hypothetical protein